MQSTTLQIFVVCFFVLTQANGFLADESREEVRIATNNFPITGLKDDVSVRNSTNLKVWIQKPPNPERSYSAMKHVCGFIPQVYVVADLKSGHPLLKYRVTTLCCPGYKKDENDNCKPHCEDGCGEGFCARPGTCLCPNIHCAFNINNSSCECPTCQGGCGMGVCMAKDYCHCYPGSKVRGEWTTRYTNSSAQCIPYCYPFCTNSYFTEPEKCECEYSSKEADDSNSIELKFRKNRLMSKTRLHKLFIQHKLPSLDTGIVTGTLVTTFSSGNRQTHYNGYEKSGTGFGRHNTVNDYVWDAPTSRGTFESSEPQPRRVLPDSSSVYPGLGVFIYRRRGNWSSNFRGSSGKSETSELDSEWDF